MPDDGLSSKIGLDTTDFKTAISSLNREIRVVESGFRASAAGLGDWAASADGLEMRIKALNGQIDLQKAKVGALTGEYSRVAAEKGANSRAAQELQIKLNKESETLGKMQTELGQTQGKLDGMGKESGEAAVQVTKLDASQEKATTSGSKLRSVLGALAGAGKVAAAGVAATAAAAVGMAVGVGKLVMKSSNAAGELVDMSLKTGISVERLQELGYAGNQVGTDLETMTGSMTKMKRGMAEVGDNKDITAAFSTLGVAARDSNGNLRDSQTVFGELIDSLGKVDNETERDVLAMQLFGKTATELNPMIKAGSKEMNRLSAEARTMGAVMDKDAVEGLEEFGDQMGSLKLGLQGTAGTVASAFMPAFSGMATTAKTYLGEFSGIVKGANGDVGAMATGIGGLIGRIVTGIAAQGPQMLQAGLSILLGISNAVITSLPTLIPAVLQMVMAIVAFIAVAAPQLMAAAVQIITALVSGLLGQLPALIGVALNLIIALAQGITGAIPQLIPVITTVIPQVLTTLIGAIPQLIPAAIQMIMALVNGLIGALPQLIAYVPQIITAVFNALIVALPMIGNAAVELVVTLVKGIVDSLPQIGEAAGKIITELVNGAKALISQIWDVGKNIVTGIWEGIQSMAGDFKKKIEQFFKGIVDAVKGILGIKSPSTVFAGIGEMMASGLGAGFSDQFRGVAREINGAMGGLAGPTMSLGMESAGIGAAGRGGGGRAINLTVNATVANGVDIAVLARKIREELSWAR